MADILFSAAFMEAADKRWPIEHKRQSYRTANEALRLSDAQGMLFPVQNTYSLPSLATVPYDNLGAIEGYDGAFFGVTLE